MANDPSADLFESIPDETDGLSVIAEIRLIGDFVWALMGRSFLRLVLIVVTVFLASFLPAALLVLWATVATQTYTRGVLIVVAFICLIPLAAVMGFNYVAYRGLRDVVEKLGFGKMIGAEFVAFLKPSGEMLIPLADFSGHLDKYLTITRREAGDDVGGIKGLCIKIVGKALLFSARVVLNRIAKGCVVDGQVDLVRFGSAVGERAGEMLISYFKRLLWDIARMIIGLLILLIWLVLFLIAKTSQLWA